MTFEEYWNTQGIRMLGSDVNRNNIPAIEERAKHAYDFALKEYQNGRDEMREQIIALIYERYCFFKKHFGRDVEVTGAFKNLINDLRYDHENELIANVVNSSGEPSAPTDDE